MISWCAYCQKYQGEVPAFDNYALSHGMCKECKTKGFVYSETEFAEILRLKKIQDKLFQAGRSQDSAAADKAVQEAIGAGAQPVDIFMGLMAPQLWQIGDLWARSEITVADEHRFTAFYEETISRIESKMPALPHDSSVKVDVLLFNAGGNVHYLGLRLLNLWLRSKGVVAVALPGNPSAETVLENIERLKPAYIGLSVAIAEQFPAANRLIEALKNKLPADGPKILIGGQAVKAGFIPDTKDVIPIANPATMIDLLNARRTYVISGNAD